MNRIPTAAAAASVPPTVVAPTVPWTAQAARSRGPSLRASGVKRSSSSSVSPTTTRPSRMPIVAGTAPAARTRRLAREPDLDPGRGGETVRDERRLQRDDGAPLAERCLDLVGDPDQVLHGRAA